MFRGLKSLAAGLLAGAALGILFSPKKGTDIRQNLKKEVDDGGTGLNTVKDIFVGMGKDIHSTCKDCYDDLNKNEKFQEGKKKVKKVAEKAKKEATKAYKKNVPAKTRKKISKGIKKAKNVAQKAMVDAKQAVEKAKKKK